MNTVIYTHGGGRFGNQLLRLLHWISWIRDGHRDVEVIDLAFVPYTRFFETWEEFPSCTYRVRESPIDSLVSYLQQMPGGLEILEKYQQRLGGVLHAAADLLPFAQSIALDVPGEEAIDLGSRHFIKQVRRSRFTLCSGWKIANWRAFEGQESSLRELMRPRRRWRGAAERFVSGLRRTGGILIGVLIRQTDYRQWHNGRFYFESEEYAKLLDRIRQQSGGASMTFLIASDAWQPPEAFCHLPLHFTSGSKNCGGHWFSSWLELSMCDLILSPPSTFAATAAFLGGIPLYGVDNVDGVPESSTRPIRSLTEASRDPLFGLAVR